MDELKEAIEKRIKEATLEQLYALHDFYVLTGSRGRRKLVDEEIMCRQEMQRKALEN